MKLLTLQNNIYNEVKRLRVELENIIDEQDYEVKIYADYNMSIKNNELESNIQLKVLDFQEEDEDEIITQVELEVNATDLIKREVLAKKIIDLIIEKRVM